jgi:GNAT superfamily N-acetyltransferase
MAASDHLSGEQFKFYPAKKYTPAPDYEGEKVKEQPGIHLISNEKGFMKWHPETGEILDTYVSPDSRRQGVATSMLKQARNIAKEQKLVSPKHSKKRSNDGDAWIQSLRKGRTSPTK